MNPSQLEAFVLKAVDQLRAGTNVEDDRVEFKRDWPDSDKARQLAGAANRAAGDDLVYIVGVDERYGVVHPTKSIDVAKWWNQIESAFDQTSPELVRHLRVHLSETETVVALQFRTDRRPYVVTVKNGGQTEREVPIRVGTRTRSAHRHELLRMLYPTISVPKLMGLTGSLRLGSVESYDAQNAESIEMALYVAVYFEHIEQSAAFLPLHSAKARLRGPRVSEVTRPEYTTPNDQSRTSGVLRRTDGIEIRGSGSSYIQARWTFPERKLLALSKIEEWKVDLVFPVAGLETEASLQMTYADRFMSESHAELADEFGWKLREES